jgi:hypothetical protein
MEDPFNFAFPNRKDLMSLQTITASDFKPSMRVKSAQPRESKNLQTSDIERAQPMIPQYKFTNKPVQTPQDLEQFQSRKVLFNNKPDFQLRNGNIRLSR